jgi:hypothetical protein
MNYHTHKLDSQSHFHIIGRQDSVTGDLIQENDEVVFCRVCQSVFLQESWEYMDRKHCRQKEVLRFIPIPVPTLIVKRKIVFKRKIKKLIFEFSDTRIESLLGLLPTAMISASLLLNIDSRYWILYILLLTFGSSLVGIIGIKLLEDKKLRKFLKMDTKLVRILETGIELQNDIFYSFAAIKKIDYIKEKKAIDTFKSNNFKTYLRIHLKNGEIIKQKINSKNYLNSKTFAFAISWIRQFTEFALYTEDQKEEGIINELERNYVNGIVALENLVCKNKDID